MTFCLFVFVFALITYWFVSKWTNTFLLSLLFVGCLLNLISNPIIILLLLSRFYVGGGDGINYLILLISSGWTFSLNNNFIFFFESNRLIANRIVPFSFPPIGYWSIDRSINFFSINETNKKVNWISNSINFKVFFSQIDHID